MLNTYEISKDTLEKILDNSSDEIFVLDGDQRVVYVNKQCERHYGLKRSEVMGKKNSSLVDEKYWRPSVVSMVYQKKQPVTILQTTYIGTELITTAVPILNKENEIELVVVTSQELQNYEIVRTTEEHHSMTDELDDFTDNTFITDSRKVKDILRLAKRIAPVNSTVMIVGESGTGKGILADGIHRMSHRKNGPFLTINCAAIPEELLESELFGYVSGAFTGASKYGKKGLIESADQGTLFLDEIGEMSLKVQAKLLQLVQDRQFIPVGGNKVKKVDVRVIAATNKDLGKLIEQGLFREDLYYRLNVIELNVPPLRERPEDIIPLTYYFLNQFNKKYEQNRLISQESIHVLRSYSWPGNVRQLQNIIERAVVMSDSIIQPFDLPHDLHRSSEPFVQVASPRSLDAALEEVEKNLVVQSYEKNPSTRKVAKDLHISQTKASKLIRKYVKGASPDSQ